MEPLDTGGDTHTHYLQVHQVDQTWLPPALIASLACVCVMAACPLQVTTKFAVTPRVPHTHTHTRKDLHVRMRIRCNGVIRRIIYHKGPILWAMDGYGVLNTYCRELDKTNI